MTKKDRWPGQEPRRWGGFIREGGGKGEKGREDYWLPIHYAMKKYCLNCSKYIEPKPNCCYKARKYCSYNCDMDFRSKIYPLYQKYKKDHCEHCGAVSEKKKGGYWEWGNKQLLVHHIDGNPANNAPSNFQTLCRPCHGKVHRRENIGRALAPVSK